MYASMVLVLVLALVWVADAAAPAAVEYRVKAVALLNFTKFTQWPATSFDNPQAPFVVGVLGEDPFGTTLLEATAGETVNGHPVQVRNFTTEDKLAGCHVVFIARSETSKMKSIQKLLATKPILTVSEIDGFCEAGGVIQFLIHENRVRFDVNRNSATEAGLTLSSRLLGVARTVIGK